MKIGGQNEDVGNDFMQYLHNSPNYSMYLQPTSQSEIEKYIKALKTSSPGYNDVSPTVLRHTANMISLPLTHIVNITLSKGIFPEKKLKYAKVIPLFKSGRKVKLTITNQFQFFPYLVKYLKG